jgi:hypothetical protein
MLRTFALLACGCFVLTLGGCDTNKTMPTAAAGGTSAPPPPPPPVMGGALLPKATDTKGKTGAAGKTAPVTSGANTAANPNSAGTANSGEKIPSDPLAAPSPPPGKERIPVAEAGKKDYGGGAIMKPITVPVAAYFGTKWRLTGFQVIDAVNKYRALHGAPPKSQQDFDRMLQDEGIQLPELPAGQKYVFDVEKQELLVEKPSE